tara:strand:- start:3366 stop:3821 length:456 start_codon:yes stop_codon:yes gene_type:complete
MLNIITKIEGIIPIKDSTLIKFLKNLNNFFLILYALATLGAIGFLVYDSTDTLSSMSYRAEDYRATYEKEMREYEAEIMEYKSNNPGEEIPSYMDPNNYMDMEEVEYYENYGIMNYMMDIGFWILLSVLVGFPICILYYKFNRIVLDKLSD